MSESLYSLSTELQSIHDELAMNGGEITIEIEEKLDALALPFNQKVHGITCWMKNLEGRETAIEAEIARLQARKKATENHRERLRTYLLESMRRAGKDKIEFDTFTVSIARNPPSCEIVDESAIPAKYITIIPETKQVNKKEVLVDLKQGPVEGARLINDKVRLAIR